MIRRATFADVDALIAMGKAGHAQSELAAYPFDETGAKYVLAVSMADPMRCAFVAERDGAIVGVLVGMEEQFAYLRARYATDVLTFAQAPGAGAALMRRFIEWAFKERRVDRVLLADTFGGRAPARAAKWYARLGARPLGGTYVIDRER